MADLRWILLLAGLIFLVALVAWEFRRPRQGRREKINPAERSEPAMGDFEPAEPPVHAGFNNPRVPVLLPPRVEISPLEPEDPPVQPLHEFSLLPESAKPLPAMEPGLEQPAVMEPPEIRAEAPPAAEVIDQPLPAAVPVKPIVEWPPEGERHIISVRVVGVSADRMSGRPLRQALAACGFVHGRFGIFHQPGADGRALISAANLSKPGVFDPSNMDFQRFRGLGLFAVLPGPLPPAAALDHLLDTAGDLAQRLQARLLDEQGNPLDEIHLEALARTVQDMSNGALRSEPAA